VSSGWS